MAGSGKLALNIDGMLSSKFGGGGLGWRWTLKNDGRWEVETPGTPPQITKLP